jgi:hypothetical protein
MSGYRSRLSRLATGQLFKPAKTKNGPKSPLSQPCTNLLCRHQYEDRPTTKKASRGGFFYRFR